MQYKVLYILFPCFPGSINLDNETFLRLNFWFNEILVNKTPVIENILFYLSVG